MKQIVFATNNAHKLRELREIMGDKIKILSLNDINCHEDIPETAPDIRGNAVLKAQYIHDNYGYDCFSDDTGLEIDALGGEPGVRSARYAGDDCNNQHNIDKVLAKMQGCSERTARFRTVVALILNSEIYTFTGEVEGVILEERRGEGGFGYDSIFQPLEGGGLTFAQMQPEQKNAISHRGRAVAKLTAFLMDKLV